MKSLDDVPYAILGAAIGAMTFSLGNLLFFQYWWQLELAPIFGGLLGYIAGVSVLRERNLPIGSTLRDFKATMK
jgi:hypothetical protein